MKRVVLSILALACATMVAGGCAKQELVKKDDQIAPAATATTPAKAASTTTQSAQQSPTGQQAAAKQVVTDSAKQAKSSDQLTAALDKVFFAFDSNALSDEARATLAKNAAFLKQNKSATVRIEGNCDERGSDEYNLALGEKRAQAARQYLITLGTAANRLSVISYGKEKPADQGHSEEAWAKNRRDEFVLVQR
jgi:peptidoglycan-associated lipoprotein